MERKHVPPYGQILTFFGTIIMVSVISRLILALRVTTWEELPKTLFILALIFGISLFIAGVVVRNKYHSR